MKYAKLSNFIVATLMAVASTNLAQAVDLSGTASQGGMLWGKVAAGTKVSLDGEPVKVGLEGNFVIGFGRDAGPEAKLALLHADGTAEEQVIEVKKRHFDVEQVDGLPPKTVTPPPEWHERRVKETGMVREARSVATDQLDWLAGFVRPAEGRFSGFYGSQRILNGVPRSPHYGLDIAGPIGRPIVAPAGGIVRLAVPDFLLEGGIVIIDHGFGVTSTLFHMNSVDVEKGQSVKQGEQIGTIGKTGRASGPHVDWRVNWGNVRLDPILLIEPEPMKGPF
ncbi:M23 family metallopeptidase [Kordiimonas gwangyangensis]|uniref:M23 family metallopeptidase n=1 Tax=Kordiimonas gwangyangensis TaxID=288022 RepID=UPI000377E3A4|nr:M23 family metallopeptidase [Kordiimonas gwangyangensis]